MKDNNIVPITFYTRKRKEKKRKKYPSLLITIGLFIIKIASK